MSSKTTRIASALIVAAASITLSNTVYAGQEWTVSTSGATALGSFTRGNGNANSPAAGTYSRGTLSIGSSFTLGTKTYSQQPGVSYSGIFGTADTTSNFPTSSEDRFKYYYRESGSIQGILDLVDSNGLLITSGLTPTRPRDPASNGFLWINGNRLNSVTAGYSSGTTPNTTAATPNSGFVNGRNYQSNGSPETTPNGQDFVRIAWSDVRFEQAFSVGSNGAAISKAPTESGYGLGNGSIGGTNYQRLRNASVIDGGTNPATTKLRNETIAVVPFNIVANPGTGLAQITKSDGAWLQSTGRLANGANFNSITREFGSGTRNQGTLNLGVDPSWGGGERDRRYTGTTPIVGGLNTGIGERPDVIDNDGNFVTINPGDEMKPELNLSGSAIQDLNENRIGLRTRFSDKISGSSGVRATVAVSRLGLGILSGGDSRDASNGSAIAGDKDSTGNPLRALRIKFNDTDGFTQATAANVTLGKYDLWSASQAVTVAPYVNASVNDTGANAYKPINGDVNDQGGPTDNTAINHGVHRKFLDNITGSVSTFTTTGTSITPADFIINGGFILPQTMTVTKPYDGAPDQDKAPGTWNESLRSSLSNSGGASFSQTNWGDPSTTNGGITNGDTSSTVSYKLFASANNANGATPNKTIQITDRTVLAGDFNGDTVRDVEDVAALALAYASPTKYIGTQAAADPEGFNYNGVKVKTRTAVDGTKPIQTTATNGAAVSETDGLVVLSDFNSNGNVTNDANSSAFAVSAVERADVRFFLYGATVDTKNFTGDDGTVYSTGGTVPSAQKRREEGVRIGALKKNASIDNFNATLDALVDTDLVNPTLGKVDGFTQSQADALKFNKFDVNDDGSANIHDAALVDAFVGKNVTNLQDQLNARVSYTGFDAAKNTGANIRVYTGTGNSQFINLIDVELTDNQVIDHVDNTSTNALAPKSDMHLLTESMIGSGKLLPGDSNLDGSVDNSDFADVFGNFGNTVTKWTQGDVTNFDGAVDNSDFADVFGNFGGGPVPLAGNTNRADLIYDPATGLVKLDATEAAGGVVTVFVLKNAAGGIDFVNFSSAALPFANITATKTATNISNTDVTGAGFSGLWTIGNVFPTGLDAAGLTGFLTELSYVGSLGSGKFNLDLIVVPEPATLGLIGLAGVVLSRRRRTTKC